MILSKFIEGLQILKPHYEGEDGFHIGAEHDQFHAYATQTPLTPEEAQRMFDLGWFQPETDEDDDGNSPYDPEEGWSAFT